REPDGPRDVGCAGLELPRQLIISRLLERDRQDHVAATLPGRHGGEQLLPAVEHPYARRAIELVAGESIEVTAESAHIDRRMWDGLSAVDQHHCTARMCSVNDALHRQNGAECVRD